MWMSGRRGGLQKIVLIPTYHHPRNKFRRHEDVPCYPGNKKCPATSFVWPPREFWLLRGEQTGGENRTDEAETSTCLARVRPETVPPLHTVATGLVIHRGPSTASVAQLGTWELYSLLLRNAGTSPHSHQQLMPQPCHLHGLPQPALPPVPLPPASTSATVCVRDALSGPGRCSRGFEECRRPA